MRAVSANDFGRTVLCAAPSCPKDAEVGNVCRHHAEFGYNPNPQPPPVTRTVEMVSETQLRCTTCREWKDDEEFYRHAQFLSRRKRSKQCRVCQAEARERRERL